MLSCMPDCDTLELPLTFPSQPSTELSPPSSGNVLDMINQDMFFGSNYQSLSSSASTEVTYACQSAATSTAPFTSAGDVFLPNLPLTSASNTFVKPTNTFTQPSSSTKSAKTIKKPKPKRGSRRMLPKCVKPIPIKPASPSQLPQNLFIPIQKEIPNTTKYTSAKSSTKNSPTKSQGLHMLIKSPSSSSSKKQGRTPPKAKGSLLTSSSHRSSFVPVVSNRKSTTVTDTITLATDVATSSFIALDTQTVTQTTSAVTRTVSSNLTVDDKWKIIKTAIITCSSITNTQSSVIYATNSQNTFTASTFTAYAVTSPITLPSIISPSQISLSVPTGKMNKPVTKARRATASPVADKTRQQFPLVQIQSSSTTTGSEPVFPQSRVVFPAMPIRYLTSTAVTFAPNATIISNNAKPPVTCSSDTAQSTHNVTNVHTTSIMTSTAASRTFAQTTLSLPPGATLYAARRIPSARVTRSQSAALTTQAQTIAIVEDKRTYTTLKLLSDYVTTTSSSHVVSDTQSSNTVPAVFGTHSSSVLSDSIVRPGSHMLISLPSSQMSPNASVGYLLSPPLGSDIIAARCSTTSATTQGATTSSVSITTISSEALNRLRTHLIPAAHNVPNTATTSLTIPATTISSDSNRGRGPVTIITNQLISGVSPRMSTASVTTTSRTLFAPSGGLFTLTAPVTTHLSSGTTADPATRTLNRLVIPVMSNILSSPNISNSTAAVTSSTSTLAFQARPQGTFILTKGLGASVTHAGITTRPSRVVIPIIHNTRAFTAGTTVVTNAPIPISKNTDENVSVANIDVHSRLRNRIVIPGTMTDSSAISRPQTPQGLYTVPSAATTDISTTKPSDTITLNPATMTLITIESAVPQSANRSSSVLPPGVTHGGSAMVSMTTATPLLASTTSRCVIKLPTTIASLTAASSVTTAVTTPITTAAISPPEHQFLVPRQSPRLRTFPGPRTIAVAQRPQPPATELHQMSVCNVTTRAANKKNISSPAPLQIFADVVNPPTSTPTTTTSDDQSKPRFTLSHCSGSSTLVVPQYKNTVFRNLSTIAHPNPERAGTVTPCTSSEKLVLNRSVAFVSPRGTFPVTQSETQGPQMNTPIAQRPPRQVQFTYADIRGLHGRLMPVATSESTNSGQEQTSTTTTTSSTTSNNKQPKSKK